MSDLNAFLAAELDDSCGVESDPRHRLIPLISVSNHGAQQQQQQQQHEPPQLRYDHAGLATLLHGDPSAAGGGDDDNDGDGDGALDHVLRDFQGRKVAALGAWGGRQDVRAFLLQHQGASAVSLRQLDDLPAGLYCYRSTRTSTSRASSGSDGGPSSSSSVRLTLLAIPLVNRGREGFPRVPANVLLLRFLHELSTHTLCLFDDGARREFQPARFPFADEAAMPVIELPSSSSSSSMLKRSPATAPADGPSPPVTVDAAHAVEAAPGFTLPLRDLGGGSDGRKPRRWQLAGGGFPAIYSLQEAASELRRTTATETTEDLVAWVAAHAGNHALSLHFATRGEWALFLRAVLPEAWARSGIDAACDELKAVRRQLEQMLLPGHALAQEAQAAASFARLVDCVGARAWREMGAADQAGEGEEKEARSALERCVSLEAADELVQRVEARLGCRALASRAEAEAARAAEIQALHELFFSGRAGAAAGSAVAAGAVAAKTLAEVAVERAAAGSLEAYVDGMKRQATWGRGLLPGAFASLFSPFKHLTADAVRQLAAVLLPAVALPPLLRRVLAEERRALCEEQGQAWPALVARHCEQRKRALDGRTALLARDIKLGLCALERRAVGLGQPAQGKQQQEEEEEADDMDDGERQQSRQPQLQIRLRKISRATPAAVDGGDSRASRFRLEYEKLAPETTGRLELTFRRLLPPGPGDQPAPPTLGRDARLVLRPGETPLLVRQVSVRLVLLVTTTTTSSSTGAEKEEQAEAHLCSLSADGAVWDRCTVHVFHRPPRAVDLDEELGLLGVLTRDGEAAVYRCDGGYRRLALLWTRGPADVVGRAAGASSALTPAPEAVGVLMAGHVDQVLALLSDGSVVILPMAGADGRKPAPPQRLSNKGWGPETRFMLSWSGPTLLALTSGGETGVGQMLNAFTLTVDGAEPLPVAKAVGKDDEAGRPQEELSLSEVPRSASSVSLGWLGGQTYVLWADGTGTGAGALSRQDLGALVLHLPARKQGDSPVRRAALSMEAGPAGAHQEQQQPPCSNSRLDALYDMLDRFAAEPLGQGEGGSVPTKLTVLVKRSRAAFEGTRQQRQKEDDDEAPLAGYARRVIEAVGARTQKPMGPWCRIQLEELAWDGLDLDRAFREAEAHPRDGWAWALRLLCLLPVQIARVEGGRLRALRDGRPVDSNDGDSHRQQTVEALASRLRFGTYDAVLRAAVASGKGEQGEGGPMPLLVVAALGPQSCGKSYLLNHLAGSLFDVAGGRCTDGVWLTVRVVGGRAMVLLDLEGMGSLERTQQEDVLMGILAAALADATLFRCHYQLDRYTQSTFERLSVGAGKARAWGSSLFQGRLCLCLKDVQESERRPVCAEFVEKLGAIQARGGSIDDDNEEERSWIDAIFGGSVRILPFSIFQHQAFFRDVATLRKTLLDDSSSGDRFGSGAEFLRLAKVVVSKLELTDWTPVGRDEALARAAAVRAALRSACLAGVQSYAPLVSGGSVPLQIAGDEELMTTTTLEFEAVLSAKEREAAGRSPRLAVRTEQAEVDEANEAEGDGQGLWRCTITVLELPDGGLVLGAGLGEENEDEEGGDDDTEVHARLRQLFAAIYPPTASNGRRWRRNFGRFLAALVARRAGRVRRWLRASLGAPESTWGAMTEVEREAGALLAAVRRARRLCDVQHACASCFAPCNLAHGHARDHDCGAQAHECGLACRLCGKQEGEGEGDQAPRPCSQRRGHAGNHSCGTHLCHKPCHLAAQARGCTGPCAQPIDHAGPCLCPAETHLCSGACAVPECGRPCRHAHGEAHARHDCGDAGGCAAPCLLCHDRCSHADHFHGLEASATTPHLCGSEHPCPSACEGAGVCGLEAVQVLEEVDDRRGFQAVTDYRDRRRRCGATLPVGAMEHEGDCLCHEGGLGGHRCDARCPSCLYYCERPLGHEGPHDCQHGNVRRPDAFRVLPRAGAAAFADDVNRHVVESCEARCARLGRGHVHAHACEGPGIADVDENEEGARLRSVCLAAGAGKEEREARHEEDGVEGGGGGGGRGLVRHGVHCRRIGWRDWCQDAVPAEAFQAFDMCPASCQHRDHSRPLEAMPLQSHCLLPLWHAPLDPSGPLPSGYEESGGGGSSGGRYISPTGCLFACVHGRPPRAHHLSFVVNAPSALGDDTGRAPEVGLVRRDEEVGATAMGAFLEALHHVLARRAMASPADRASLLAFSSSSSSAVFADKRPGPRLVQTLLASPPGSRAWAGMDDCDDPAALHLGLGAAYEGLQAFRRRLSARCLICHASANSEGGGGGFVVLTACQHVLCPRCADGVEQAQPPACPGCMAPCCVEGGVRPLQEAGPGATTGPAVRMLQRPLFVLLTDTLDGQPEETLKTLQRMAQGEEAAFPECTCWEGPAGFDACPSQAHRLLVHFVVWGPPSARDHARRLGALERAAAAGRGQVYFMPTPDPAVLRQAFDSILAVPASNCFKWSRIVAVGPRQQQKEEDQEGSDGGRLSLSPPGATTLRKRKMTEEDQEEQEGRRRNDAAVSGSDAKPEQEERPLGPPPGGISPVKWTPSSSFRRWDGEGDRGKEEKEQQREEGRTDDGAAAATTAAAGVGVGGSAFRPLVTPEKRRRRDGSGDAAVSSLRKGGGALP